MALAETMLRTGRGVNGSAFFVGGMSSAPDPMFIDDRSYRSAMNVTNRSGVLRTRPGYREVFELPEGKLQGAEYFRPIAGTPYIVFVVSGKVYSSAYPFNSYEEVEGIGLYEHAKHVYFATAVRSAQRNDDGTISVINPKKVLIIQDGGYSAAVWFDGSGGGKLDAGKKQTPIGGPMAWSGDRLWVARDNRVFASDISDPFSFTENEYAAEGGFFMFPERVVALAEIPAVDIPLLAVFCESMTSSLQSSNRTRSTWKSTKDFQSTLFPGIGCVSHRSVVAQYGQLWWMAQNGLTNFDAARLARVSSRLNPQDAEMAVSKANVWADMSSVCAGKIENFLLVSVPNGDRYNAHTWVMDGSVIAESQKQAESAWAGYWTGTRPVQWISGLFQNEMRVFHVSYDYDGKNRLWEAFWSDHTDNGAPIRAFVETKLHVEFSDKATGLDLKRFVFAEATFTDLLGDVDVSIFWAGNRGQYKKLGDWRFIAPTGSPDVEEDLTNSIKTYRSQTRTIRTPELTQSVEDNTGYESSRLDWLDTGFSLLIIWSGQASLRSYRIFADPEQESGTGSQDVIEDTGYPVTNDPII